VTQYDVHQSAPQPGGYPTGQPVYGQPGYQPQRTNTMAILGLVFAFVFSPLGVVFSAIGLKQVKERREGGRGLALAGLILSIVFILLGILLAVIMLAVVTPAVEAAVQAEESAAFVEPAADPTGVVAACETIVPAVLAMDSELATVTTPEDYAAVLTGLRMTMESAAAGTTDPEFIAHVQTLSGDFRQAADAVANGQDPAFLQDALATDGTAIDNDCAAAGYVP